MPAPVDPRSTDAVPWRGFPAHGRVVFSLDERLLLGDARGPFNPELVAQLRLLLPGLIQHLGGAEWNHLCRFHESAMCSPETLHALGALLMELAQAGQAPRRTAYVMGDAVEGAHLMMPLIEQGFLGAGLTFRGFGDEADARAWLAR